jgi:glycosyltransferase involved in cell wall biosynthesis
MNKDFSDFSYEIIFVNDGSKDNTRKEMGKIKNDNLEKRKLIAINLQRNYGQSTALAV